MQYPAPPGGSGPSTMPPGNGYGYGGYPGAGQPPPWTAPDQFPGYPGGAHAVPGYYGEQLPPGPPTRAAGKRAASGVAIFILVAGLLAAAFSAFLFFRGAAADTVARMVPADAAVYSSYYLDPPGAQKVNLNSLIAKFPALSSAAAKNGSSINDALDSGLRSFGMDHTDVTGWLGGQVGVSVAGNAYASDVTTPAYAVFIATKNDGLTQSMLTKLQSSPLGAPFTFTSESYDGITITFVGAPRAVAGATPVGAFAYAIVDHALVVSANVAYMKAIIDTGHGRRPGLEAGAEYRTVQSRLPHDRLFMLYVDFPSALKAFKAAAAAAPGAQAPVPAALDASVKAIRSLGITASAAPEGFAIDSIADFDAGQLDEQSRQALGIPAHANSTSGDTPANAMGFLGVTGTQYLLHGLLDGVRKASPEAARVLDSIGLAAAASHFTGDSGIEFGTRDGKTPVGAWIVATDNEKATRAFLDQAIPSLMAAAGSLSGSATPTANPAPVTVTHEAYKGVDISEAGNGGSSHPSWTVTKGIGIVATDPAEARAIIDAANGGANLAGSARFDAALGDGVKSNTVLYVDVQNLINVLEATLPAADRQSFDTNVLPNLRPIQAIVITQINSADHTAGRLLVKIQ